ncbi:MAG TPA: acyl-CoA desaturase [Acidimicrobiia bacterium]|nr:acyl-CoA desaturase [Acidimicrobiia bacterium]
MVSATAIPADPDLSARPPHDERLPDERLNVRSSIPFGLVHLVPFLAIFTGVTEKVVLLAFATFAVRMFLITAGYHRYFSHRSFRTNRVVQFLLAFGGTMAAQKGPLWWAAHHRNHHQFADTDDDAHSPRRGFWWSHVGWILCDKYGESRHDNIRDFAKYPELRFLDKHDWIGPWTLGVACYLIGGWSGLVVGFFASTVLLWHVTFTVNSLAHVFGSRKYDTTDTSRNNVFIALATGGEGWHNNHHRYPFAARQGFRWWQIDTTYYVLRLMAALGLVRDLRPVPAEVVAEGYRVKPRK